MGPHYFAGAVSVDECRSIGNTLQHILLWKCNYIFESNYASITRCKLHLFNQTSLTFVCGRKCAPQLGENAD